MVNEIYKKVKRVLLADPELLYKEEKDLIKKPFYFQGTNKKAVLLIHGWTVVPYEVRRLGMYLNENGYTAAGPMLRGHGTEPKDLENIKWNDWLHDIKKAYRELKETHDKVYVAGTSVGANLAALLASEEPDVSGLILMAMPYKLKLERTVMFLAKLNLLFRNYNKKYYPPTFGVSTTITRLISYQVYPIRSAIETFDLMEYSRAKLGKINQPCFISQSTSDHIVARNSLEKIYAQINSKVKQKKYIKRAYHTFISDIKNEGVFEDILNFLNEN